MKSEKPVCQNCKRLFIIESEDLGFYMKIDVPPPTFCPECRLIRRMIWRNEHSLFKKKDESSGKLIFSSYPSTSKIKIFNHDYWWSDSWDPKHYGVDFDTQKTFFEQFYNLMLQVPWSARSVKNSINSDYCNNISDLKNAYLCFSGKEGENLAYGFMFSGSHDCVDFYQTKDSRLCYETFSVVDSEKVFYSMDCAQCLNIWFSKNCRNCSDLFGCVNLRYKKYCIFNEQYTKEAYEIKVKELFNGSHDSLVSIIKRVFEFQKRFPVKFIHGMRNNHVSGDYIYASNNTWHSFEVHNVDNIKFSQFIRWTKDSYDFTSFGVYSELIYESVNCGDNSQNLKFCFECWPSSYNLEYCVDCHSCSDCFGCVGLKKAKYCIFNKQYTKESFYVEKQRIIESMNQNPYVSGGITYRYGEFFPPEFSPFPYNQSSANNYFPLVSQSENKLLQKFEVHFSEIPQTIGEVDESIIGKIISCKNQNKSLENCKDVFKITNLEFYFYKRFNLPLPRTCPSCRFYKRMEKLNPIQMRYTKCMCESKSHKHIEKCKNEFFTHYPSESPLVLFCEDCYQLEVA